ncbi:MAG: hypothetical protein MUF64_21260 [Polyangiaceae bacterium]|jgi:hypothetical protein|nr:hypothetical protein [Polyangiaceae bacterium]
MEGRSWAELVFHVLAHVEQGATLAPSLFDERYIEQAARWLGPSQGRALGEDAQALGLLLRDHEAMAQAQGLAWLFDDVEEALAAGHLPLAGLGEEQVARPSLLAGLRSRAAELLFCAALLEEPCWRQLPAPEPAVLRSLRDAIRALERVAPGLRGLACCALRPLGQRGRAVVTEVWVGVPGWGQASIERCAWQAAHEATVLEVEARCTEVRGWHEAREELAVALLSRRARGAGLGDAHGRWLAGFAPPVPVLGGRLEGLVREASGWGPGESCGTVRKC